MVKSAERILDILELFALRGVPLGLSQIAGQLGIPKSSTLMLLRTLEARGYVRRDGDRYRLDPVWVAEGGPAGWAGARTMRLIRLAEEVMRDLVEQLQETAVLGVPGPEHEVRVVANVVSPLKVRYDRSRISVIPAYCTAMGQAMLAFQPGAVVERYIAHCGFAPQTDRTITEPEAFRARLAEIRARGWAINLEERFLGAVGIAVPILEPGGAVLAALNVGTVTARFERRRDDIVAALQEGAAYIAEHLGASGPGVEPGIGPGGGEQADARGPASIARVSDSGGA